MSAAFCQTGNSYLQVSNSLTNFNLSTVSGLENIQTQTNAFGILIRSQNNSYYVSARISNYSSSTGAYLSETMLGIRNTGVTPSRAYSSNTIYLSGYDQQIISGTQTGSQIYTYQFNIMLGPIGYSVPPGTYNMTILFTMTVP